VGVGVGVSTGVGVGLGVGVGVGTGFGVAGRDGELVGGRMDGPMLANGRGVPRITG
jgi:hypothetical protein